MAAPTFRQLKGEYAALWRSMTIAPSKLPAIDRIATKLIAAKPRYQSVAGQTGVPWAAIALIHQMECGGDWRLSIAQGDPWNRVSTHVPKGRGPFDSWEAAAIDALSIDGADRVKPWSVERLCYELEKYNGFGSRNKGIHTPYLWSFSNHYSRGKYVADHVWDGRAVSGQAGAMPLLKRMMALDPSIGFGQGPPAPPDVEPAPAPPPAKPMVRSKTFWAQIVAVLTAVGGAVTDWRIAGVLVIGAIAAFVIFERARKPDMSGFFR
jgi:lysozyme family protein